MLRLLSPGVGRGRGGEVRSGGLAVTQAPGGRGWRWWWGSQGGLVILRREIEFKSNNQHNTGRADDSYKECWLSGLLPNVISRWQLLSNSNKSFRNSKS